MFRNLFVVLAGLLTITACASASITDVRIADDNDGAIHCTAPWSLSNPESLTISGNQLWGPGHMVGTITTDDPNDPNLTIHNTIDNDTGFAWTGFIVNVYMPVAFTVSNIIAYDPNDWTGTLTMAPTSGTWMIDGNPRTAYKATITYTGGTAVQPDTDSFEFGYKIKFSGATSYDFCQEMTPIPEPVTLALLGFGAAGLISRRRRA
jgi:hypothetical protein